MPELSNGCAFIADSCQQPPAIWQLSSLHPAQARHGLESGVLLPCGACMGTVCFRISQAGQQVRHETVIRSGLRRWGAEPLEWGTQVK